MLNGSKHLAVLIHIEARNDIPDVGLLQEDHLADLAALDLHALWELGLAKVFDAKPLVNSVLT